MRDLIFAVLCSGIPASLLGMLGIAALLTAVDLPFPFHTAAAAAPLLSGCFLAAYRAGKRQRRGGLYCGFLAAFLLTALWYAAACLFCRRLYLPVLLLLSLPCGMCGGVCGVNTQLPVPHRRPHAAKRLSGQLAISHEAKSGIRRAKRKNAAQQSDENDAAKHEMLLTHFSDTGKILCTYTKNVKR